MEKCYTINEVAMMTGLTTRTLRNYIKMGFLDGKKSDGVWRFTEEEVSAFISNPNVKPSIQAKNKAIIFDFLSDTGKSTNELCVVLDLSIDKEEAGAVSGFFCEQINNKETGKIRYSFEQNGKHTRVILSGHEDVVMQMLNAYTIFQ